MPDRLEILRELGLTPVWRLRTPGSTAPIRADLDTANARAPQTPTDRVHARADAKADTKAGAEDGPTAVARAQPVADANAERRIRIARLDWSDFATDVAACTACALSRTRTLTVPGVGDRQAEWMFVGEAPGAEEDAKGEPFVGQAGRLLDNMLAALGLQRNKYVYIANVLKCRPPNNRAPEPNEVESCQPYLDRQLVLIKPKLIVALGKSAATTLLGFDATIASLRGRVHRYQGIPLIVTYHPAYLLRSLPEKAKAWEDLCLARATLRGLQSAQGTPT